jgi:DNA polymerase III sliding clamp (beta) subunit (PCNA family)
MIPRNAIEKVFSLLSGKTEFFVDDNNKYIRIVDSNGLTTTVNLFDGSYPILGKIIEQNKYQNKFIMDRDELISAIKIVKPFASSIKAIELSKIDSNTLKIYAEGDNKEINKTVNIKLIDQKYNNNIKQSNNLDIIMPIALAQERQAGKENVLSFN